MGLLFFVNFATLATMPNLNERPYMKISRFALLGIMFLLVSNVAFAQNKYTESANESFEAKEYFIAKDLYKKAYSKEKSRQNKAWINFRIGECFRLAGDDRNAANYYKRAIRMRYEDPIAILYLARAYKNQGEYEDAIVEYTNYKQEVPDDKRAEEGIQEINEAKLWMETPSRYQVENFTIANSKSNDFSPAFGKKDYTELYFTSSREEANGRELDGWTGQAFTDVFMTTVDRKGRRGRRNKGGSVTWTTPVPVDEVINSPYNEGSVSFNKRFNIMYFTRCEKLKKKTMGCSIYMARKRGASFAEPEILSISQDSGTTVGHPSMSPDDKVLYFAADIEGGYGGRDLYKASYDRRKKSWGTPENLGPTINTEGNEMFPFIHDDGFLYFASDGHPGMGGLDVFKAELKDGNFSKPENMKYPINSYGDDFGLVWAEDKTEKGFVTSNRKGGRGGDDIYEVTLMPLLFTLEGVVTDARSGETIEGAAVKLIGSNGNTMATVTDSDGEYLFDMSKLKEDVTYTLNFSRDEYLNKSGSVTTVGVPFSSFEQIEEGFLHRLVHNKAMDPKRRAVVLPKIEYDLGSAELRLEGKDALDDLVEVLEDNPTITIELRSHTDFRGTDAANKKLSEARALSAVRYLISKGVDSLRMKPVGMGEKEPYTLDKDEAGFEAGTVFSEAFIRGLATEEEKELAHQFNRRTDFKVLKDNFRSKKPKVEEPKKEENNSDDGGNDDGDDEGMDEDPERNK